MDHFRECYSSAQAYEIVDIITKKANQAKQEEGNFLLYVRNPVKVCLLLSGFLNNRLRVKERFPCFQYQADFITKQLIEIAQ